MILIEKIRKKQKHKKLEKEIAGMAHTINELNLTLSEAIDVTGSLTFEKIKQKYESGSITKEKAEEMINQLQALWVSKETLPGIIKSAEEVLDALITKQREEV